MDDFTEVRRQMVERMADEALAAVARGEQTWTTEQLKEDFTVVGFLAPFVVVERRADGATGTLQFSHHPRLYFAWLPD
jgi:hypothetical protein